LPIFYNSVLPADGSFATVFHHLCMKIPGPVEAWYEQLEGLSSDKRMACYVDSVRGLPLRLYRRAPSLAASTSSISGSGRNWRRCSAA